MKLNNVSETDLAYCAGLFDGEGCIHIGKATAQCKRGRVSPYYGLVASLLMTRYEAIQKFEEIFGGTAKPRNRKPPAKNVWERKIYGENVQDMAKVLLPYLRIKREQALLAIQFREHMAPFRWIGPIQLSVNELQLREGFRQQMKELNARGVH
jgi:hypothetical protein